MANKNEKGSKNSKIVVIAALLAAISIAVVAFYDGDPETKPDVGAVIDSGRDVIDEFGNKSKEPEIDTDGEAAP
jgi:hypothetical protein